MAVFLEKVLSDILSHPLNIAIETADVKIVTLLLETPILFLDDRYTKSKMGSLVITLTEIQEQKILLELIRAIKNKTDDKTLSETNIVNFKL